MWTGGGAVEHPEPATDVTAAVLVAMAAHGMRRNIDLAHLLGWSEAKTSRKLNSQTPWTLEDLDALAVVFGCRPCDFLGVRHLSAVPVDGGQLTLPFGEGRPVLSVVATYGDGAG